MSRIRYVYWFIIINRTNESFTLNHEVVEIRDDKVIKIIVNLGFRIQPRAELYFKKILKEVVEKKELSLHLRPDGSTKYNAQQDFKFIILEKFLSVENEFSVSEGFLMNSYYFLKSLSLSDSKAFGLDKSDVAIEEIPIVYHPSSNITLHRKN